MARRASSVIWDTHVGGGRHSFLFETLDGGKLEFAAGRTLEAAVGAELGAIEVWPCGPSSAPCPPNISSVNCEMLLGSSRASRPPQLCCPVTRLSAPPRAGGLGLW